VIVIYFLLNSDFKTHLEFLKKRSNPIFVTYPRTGTHWIMTCLEEYFNQPVLFDSYTNNEVDVSKVLIVQTHDNEARHPSWRPFLSIIRSNVIVSCREPVDAIFSWIFLSVDESKKLNKKERVTRRALKYKAYINKWIRFEKFTERKTIISYSNLVKDFNKEFSKAIVHLGGIVDNKKINIVKEKVTKEFVKAKYPADISNVPDYENQREEFYKEFGDLIITIMGDSHIFCVNKGFFKSY
jgi:hypothetical protein